MLFLGFTDFHEFLRDARPGPVYMLSLATDMLAESPEFGQSEISLVVQAFDSHNDNIIRYWQIRLGTVATRGGIPIRPETRDRMDKISRSARDFLDSEIRGAGRGFCPTCALIAIPTDVVTIVADMTELDYDGQANTFRWKNPPPPGETDEPPPPEPTITFPWRDPSASIDVKTTDEPGDRPWPPAPPGALPFANTAGGRTIGYINYKRDGGKLDNRHWQTLLRAYLGLINIGIDCASVIDPAKLETEVCRYRALLFLGRPV